MAKKKVQVGGLNSAVNNPGCAAPASLSAATAKRAPAPFKNARVSDPFEEIDGAAIRAEIIRIFTTVNPGREQREAIARAVVPALLERGCFFYHSELRDHDSAMFFDRFHKRLHRIRSDWFQSWLSRWIAIGRSEVFFRSAASAVEDASLNEDISIPIIPETFWAARKDSIYLSNGDAQIAKITAGKVELVDNGTDEVLFAAGKTLAPWRLIEPLDPFESCSVFRDANCSADHGLDLIRLWVLSLPTNQLHKPPLCLAGDVGSGKTRLAGGIAELYGVPFIANSVDDFGERDFWVSVDGGGFLTLDNCDVRVKWLPEEVNKAATGGCRRERSCTRGRGSV